MVSSNEMHASKHVTKPDRHNLKQIRRSDSVPALMCKKTRHISLKKNNSVLQWSAKEFSDDMSKSSHQIYRTVSLDNCTEQDERYATSTQQCLWTPEKLTKIAKYFDRPDPFEEKIGGHETDCCDFNFGPRSTTRKKFINQIKKSSILQLCEDNSVGVFHLNDDCEEEHCLIAKQVFRLIEDLLQKCTKIDPKMESRLLWVGSSAEGTKMWLPDEFDFLMKLVKLEGEFELAPVPSGRSSGDVILSRECHNMWSDLCTRKYFRTLSFIKLKKYIIKLLWKAATLLDRSNYENLRYTLCKYNTAEDTERDTFMKKTKVGMNFSVCWNGKKYKNLMISIDLTPTIQVDLSEEVLQRRANQRVCTETFHVVPYVYDCETWRPSFSVSEAAIVKGLPPTQRSLYKALKFLRDVHKDQLPDIPSYVLKTFLLNLISKGKLCGIKHEEFHLQLCHVLHHLQNKIVKTYGIEHFYLENKLELNYYDMKWVRSSLKRLTKN